MSTYQINKHISLKELADLGKFSKVELGEEAKNNTQKCYDWMHGLLENSDHAYYGINTGFGALCNTVVPKEKLGQLQYNLVVSHACGAGKIIAPEIVKQMLFLKALGLSKGHSGVDVKTVQFLLDLYNNNIIPVVYEAGSLGASGDLAPLAHLSLPLIGEGEVFFEGKIYPSKEILDKFNLKPISLQAKEGLALLNGTQFMSGIGTHIYIRARRLWHTAHAIAALSAEAFNCRHEAFDSAVYRLRPHAGQIKSAELMRTLIEGSEYIFTGNKDVQDPYSFRCIPQVHGASWDVLLHAGKIFETEINSVTDNPLIVPEEEKIISGGNFHGQTLAITLDHLAIAISEMGSISERRIYRLISGKRDLPPCLVENPGINSGFMIVQYTAAALASKNKQLCTPASADSIESSLGQEDHVSMGANAAVQCLDVLENTERILGMELLAAYQGLLLRTKKTQSPFTAKLVQKLEAAGISKIVDDVYMHPRMEKAFQLVKELYSIFDNDQIWKD